MSTLSIRSLQEGLSDELLVRGGKLAYDPELFLKANNWAVLSGER